MFGGWLTHWGQAVALFGEITFGQAFCDWRVCPAHVISHALLNVFPAVEQTGL